MLRYLLRDHRFVLRASVFRVTFEACQILRKRYFVLSVTIFDIKLRSYDDVIT